MDFKDKIFLAPMAGITDLPFRLLCKEQGADIVVTEMISAKGMYYGNRNSLPLLMTDEREAPAGVQLFGSEPDIIAGQAAKMKDLGFAFIDLNFGCPVPKIVNNHEGSSLMKTPERIGEIVYAIRQATDLPVTVKIRAGFSADSINAPEVARVAEEAGASAVAVHARTREQYYSGTADWSVIKAVKDAVNIPVVGNGDITCGADVIRMKEETDCDSVMVGRAAKGNPWVFAEIKHYLETGERSARPSVEEIVDTMLRQVKMMIEQKSEYVGIREMRKHVAWYTQGMYDSAKLRAKINEIETQEELEGLLLTLSDSNRL